MGSISINCVDDEFGTALFGKEPISYQDVNKLFELIAPTTIIKSSYILERIYNNQDNSHGNKYTRKENKEKRKAFNRIKRSRCVGETWEESFQSYKQIAKKAQKMTSLKLLEEEVVEKAMIFWNERTI